MRVMSADWTTCRVVRDRDGDLWFRGCDSDDLWTAQTNYPDVFLTADELHTAFGGLTPVLDADGQPVVRTVGDLTARHIGSTDGWCHTTAHYSPHVKADTPDPRLHVLARRLPDWPTDDLADLLAELDTAVTL